MKHGRVPERENPGPSNDLKTIATLLPYLWPAGEPNLRLRVVISICLLVAAKATNVTVPFFYKGAVDALSPSNIDATTLVAVPLALLVGYGLCRVLAQAFGEFKDAVFAKVAQRAIRQAGLKTFRHLHKLSLRFHLDRKTGGVSRAVERGAHGIEFLLTFTLFNILPTLIEILLVCGVLWALFDVWYALVTFVSVASYITWTLLITEWRIKYRRTMNETDNEANNKAIDSLLNFETVKYFGNEEHESERFDKALRAYETAAVKSKTSLSLLNIGQGAVIAVGLTILMVMAGNGVANGTMTIGDFVLVNAYLIQLYIPLNFLGFVYREIKRCLADMEHMFDLMAEHPEIEDKENSPDLILSDGHVSFEKVAFSYDERRPIIKGISFDIPAGKSVAIVGPTGSGKSTLSRLLFRFYEVSDGSIKIDGQDLREVTQRSVRAAIGMVPQDTVLFNDTIYYNIAYGQPGATPSEIEEAARLAQIHDFIQDLPDGYQTTVGERGLKLSGGEKQRVAIARTILKRPEILVFDEATSALDTHTEREIQESLNAVSTDHTTLIIAHRLSTVVGADEIIVLEQGEIAERGNHRALLRKKGKYHAMWTRQQEAAKAKETLAKVEEAPSPEAAE